MIETKVKAWISLEFEIEFETTLRDGINSNGVDDEVIEQLKASLSKVKLLSLPSLKLESCSLFESDYDVREVELYSPSSHDSEDAADDRRHEIKLERNQ